MIKYWTRWINDFDGKYHEVQLHDGDYTGSPQHVAADRIPAVLSYGAGSGDGVYMASTLTYKPYQVEGLDFDEIFAAAPGRFMLRYYINGVKVWEGNVITDLYEERTNTYPQAIDIIATDGLGNLSEIPYEVIGAQEDTASLAEIASECLANTGHSHGIVIADEINEDSNTNHPWRVEARRNRLEEKTCREVLQDELLNLKGCSIALWTEQAIPSSYAPGEDAETSDNELQWHIIQRSYRRLDSLTFGRYNSSGGWIGSNVRNITTTIDQVNNFTLTGASTVMKSPVRRYDRIYNHDVPSRVLLRNGNFDIWATPSNPASWVVENLAETSRSNDSVEGSFSARMESGDITSPSNYISQQFVGIGVIAGDVGALRVGASFAGDAVGAGVATDTTWWAGELRSDDGSTIWWLQPDGSWQTGSPTIQWNPVTAVYNSGPSWRQFLIDTDNLPTDLSNFTLYLGNVAHDNGELDAVLWDFVRLDYESDFIPRNIGSSIFRRDSDQGVVEEKEFQYGDGPTGVHPGRLFVGSSPTLSWSRGDTAEMQLHEIMTREFLRMFAFETKVVQPTFRANLTPVSTVIYRGERYMPDHVESSDMREGYWSGEWRQHRYDDPQTSFNIIRNVDDTISGSGGGGDPSGASEQSVVETIDGLSGNLETDITGIEGVDFSGSVVSGGQAKLTDGGVTEAKLDNLAVSTAKVQNAAITEAKLASDSVATSKIQNDAVTIPKAVFTDQNLRQADTPTFSQLVLSSAGSATGNAVRADRTLRMLADTDGVVSWNPSTAQNLTDNRTFRPTFMDAGAAQRGLMGTGAQTFAGDKTFNNDVKLSNDSELISASGFTHGFLGSGFRKRRDNEEWEMELDRLWIRRSLFATEFIINQISAINGSDILSAGAGKVEEVQPALAEGDLTLTVSDATGNAISPFVTGDFIRIQQVTPDAFSGGGTIVKSLDLEVLNLQDNKIDVAVLSGSVGDVAVGDILVVIASSVAGRQAAIYRTVTETDSPFVRVMAGLSSRTHLADPTKAVVQYGKLDNLSGEFPEVSGYGLFVKDRFYARMGDTNVMALGREAGGSGKHGIKIGDNDYLYGDKTFSLGGGIINGTASEARIARLEARSNRIYYQSRDVTDVPMAGTFSGLAASDQPQDGSADFIRPAFFAGAASDGPSDARSAKVRLWPDGKGYFGDDVEVGGNLFNTPETFLLTATTNYNPAAKVVSTATYSTSHNLADGALTPYVGSVSLEGNQIHRYWFRINVATGGISYRPRFRFYLETFQTPPDDYQLVDHENTAILPYFRLVSGSGSWTPFNITSAPGYIEFEADVSADNQNVTFYAIFYVQAFPGWDATRMRMQSMIDDGALTQTLQESRIRVYRRRTSITGGGLFIVDTDIHKRAIDAINGDYLLPLTINDAVI